MGLPTYFLCLLGDGAGEAARRRARAEQLEAFAARERQAQNIGFLQGRGIRRMGFGMLDVWICSRPHSSQSHYQNVKNKGHVICRRLQGVFKRGSVFFLQLC